MKIKNIRYGFANNSSSAHSIVFLNDYIAKDNEIGDSFGWNFFTAASKKAKQEYLLATLFAQRNFFSFIPKTTLTEKVGWSNPFNYTEVVNKYNLSYEEYEKSNYKEIVEYGRKILERDQWQFLIENYGDILEKELIESWRDEEEERSWGNPTVDHQSVIALPIECDGSTHTQFARELFKVLIENNFAFLGGNDNTDESHDLVSYDTYSDKLDVMSAVKVLGTDRTGPLCVYDKENDDYVLQNDRNGNKVRFSFKTNEETKKSSFPELVDLKITNHCGYGCTFCYQSSTKEGKHGGIEEIETALNLLAKSKTMEIAIGGGEPTSHPEILRILQKTKSLNMLTCFTTKNFDLNEHPDFLEILKTTDSIAFSCNSLVEVQKFFALRTIVNASDLDWDTLPDLYIQMIPELMSDEIFDKILSFISENMWGAKVTLLGYKDFGFGEKYKPKNRFATSQWIDTVKKYSNIQQTKFGIDSVLVSKWKKELIEQHVDPLAMVGEEGKFSCYLDAVNMTVHKSSFSKDSGIELTGKESDIIEYYKTF